MMLMTTVLLMHHQRDGGGVGVHKPEVGIHFRATSSQVRIDKHILSG